MSPRLRVLTLNLWGTQGDWQDRRSVLAEGLAHCNPDVITFQESIVTKDYDQVDDLLSADYQVIHQEGRSSDGTGNSVASRLPFGPLKEAFLHVSPRVDRAHGWIGSIAALKVTAPQPIGDVLLVHLKPSWQPDYDRERELQSVAAANFIQESVAGRDIPVVLAGDLDASPDSRSIRFWRGEEMLKGTSVRYVDAWGALHPQEEGHTFTPRNPLVRTGDMPGETGRRIDYIFLRGGDEKPYFTVAACTLVFDRPVGDVWASDHFGVMADLDVSTNRQDTDCFGP
jgi:endonuclease/exonuclease/phosphatase family metal-dependent hydrolase